MKLKPLLRIICCFSLFLSCIEKKKSVAVGENKPLNVLMISVDDLNSYLGYLGDANAVTPNMDRLAANGVAFTNAHCQAPLCGPSRASLMSGLRPSTSGIYGMIKDDLIKSDNEVTKSITFLPEYFKNHGYKTLGVGKLFHTYAPKGNFEGPGRFVGEKPNHNFGPVPEKRMAWQGYPLDEGKNYKGPKTSTDWGAFPEQDSLMPDYKAVQWIEKQLAQNLSKNPFFMAIGFLRPHVPWHVPQKWFDMYPLDNIVLPPYLADDMNDVPEIAVHGINDLPMMPTTAWAIKTNNWKKMMQAYLACISFVDHEIGKLLDALEKSPYADNTLVVLWSDHGYRVGEKGTFAKQCLWEEATKTPLIISGPNIPKHKKINTPVELLSIYPTLLDLCQLPPNPQNEGISLVPLIEGKVDGKNFNAITTYGWSNHTVRTKDHRYIRYEDGSEELYDKNMDPNEFTNLANNDKYVTIKNGLKDMLPKVNNPWHKYSSYNFGSYFLDQKERVNAELIKK
tara:strand:+ start:2143 stop:3666 length:1524 start_codon:yes stop_codon:yes gene_type:complete